MNCCVAGDNEDVSNARVYLSVCMAIMKTCLMQVCTKYVCLCVYGDNDDVSNADVYLICVSLCIWR